MMSSQTGVATFEAALISSFLAVFVLGGVAMVNYLQEVTTIRDLANHSVRDEKLSPFAIDAETHAATTLRRDELFQSEEQIAKQLQKALGGEGISAHEYLIELAPMVLRIDEGSGHLQGVEPVVEARITHGSRFSPVHSCPSSAELLRESAEKQDIRGRSVFAVPKGVGSGQMAFLPRSLIVAVRVVKELKASAFGELYSTLGIETAISSCGVVTLRGEIG